MTAASAPRLSEQGKKALDELLAARVESKTIPSATFGATTADGPVYFAKHGERVFGEPDKGQLADDTWLRLYSMTKLVTSVAVLQLVERGLVDLDSAEQVEQHLPDLCAVQVMSSIENGVPKTTPRTAPLTVRRLLSHTSGLGYAFSSPLLEQWLKTNNLLDHWATDAAELCHPLTFQPGTRWQYGIGIDWAGIFVERVSGQNLEDYFQDNIFKPLGIDEMTFVPSPAIRGKMQQLVTRDAAGKLVHGDYNGALDRADGDTKALFHGGGGLLGTARGYLRFLQGVLASNCAQGGILSQKSFQELFTTSLPPRGEGNTCHADMAAMCARQGYHDPEHTANDGQYLEHSVGLVVNTKDSVNGRKKGSGCWDGAAKTQYWLDPSTGIAGICFTQLMAPNPDPWMKVYNEFERALYDALE